ncbi:MAG TPA: TIGR03435 family protein [Bryobacteraceae bacterium]|nr:TIGR03435 family protein [Bryobacteraceae bacterium]
MLRAAILCLMGVSAWAQNFEAAEIRVNPSGEERSSVHLANGALTMHNVSLRILLAEIYLMTPDDIVGPSWLSDVHVDIAAKAPSHDASDADLREMTKALLRDRMKMVAHLEPRPRSVWALEVWKGWHKLKPSTSPARPEDAACRRQSAETGIRFFCQHMSMAEFAHEIPEIAGRYTDQRVVDRTGLEGWWEFTLEWTPSADLEANGGLTLFAALQSQLGLQLASKKLPVPVVIIDSMERAPAEN